MYNKEKLAWRFDPILPLDPTGHLEKAICPCDVTGHMMFRNLSVSQNAPLLSCCDSSKKIIANLVQ